MIISIMLSCCIRIISVDGDPIDFADIPMLNGIPLLFEREDDWSCCTYFYLDKPENNLPELMDVSERTKDLVARPGFMGKYPQDMPLFRQQPVSENHK